MGYKDIIDLDYASLYPSNPYGENRLEEIINEIKRINREKTIDELINNGETTDC